MGEADRARGQAPTGSDYRFAALAGLGVLLGLLSLGVAVWGYTDEGLSLDVVSRSLFALGTSCWLAVVAWRRTVWGRPHPGSPG